jgi:hypothetical protein
MSFMMANQAAFGSGTGGLNSQLNSQLMQSFSHDGASPLRQTQFSHQQQQQQQQQQQAMSQQQQQQAMGQQQRQGGWDANMVAAAAVANDQVRSIMMQANHQAEDDPQAGNKSAGDPMSTLLQTVQMHHQAVWKATGGARARGFSPAVLDAINKASTPVNGANYDTTVSTHHAGIADKKRPAIPGISQTSAGAAAMNSGSSGSGNESNDDGSGDRAGGQDTKRAKIAHSFNIGGIGSTATEDETIVITEMTNR